MQKRKSFFNNELEQRFSLRKYTIGLCSVCLGFVAIGMGSQTVKADTVNDVEKSSAVQENKAQGAASANADALPESKTNMPDSAKAKPNATPTETKEGETGSVVVTAPKTNATSTGANANTTDSATPTETKLNKANPVVANSNNSLAQSKLTKTELIVQPKVGGASTETKPNEHGSSAANPNAVSTEAKPNAADPASLAKIKPQRMRLAKLVDTKAFAESKVATDNQFNFDDWTTQVDDTYLNITGYKGDRSKQIVVPNGADFAKAGKNDKNLQVEIDKDTLADLIVDGVAPKLSNTDGQKIVAKGKDWSDAFSWDRLHDISGLSNLDTSNVTNMNGMFADNGFGIASNGISDLSPLANWNTGNVTDMGGMFESNQISDLSPLANWNIGNVTNMSDMFKHNSISDLSSLANWNTNNVTNMSAMFYNNRISDLSPLANWNTGNVTDMGDNTGGMFESNQISDLSPLANWNIGNVTNMSSMFESNQISDLSSLANWNIGNVTNMHGMFMHNRISDLRPLSNWNISNVTDMGGDTGGMFEDNQINDLSPLANWNTDNVTNMSDMFKHNQISNLNSLTNWNTDKVTNMSDMFKENPLNLVFNSQSALNKFHVIAYKLDNIGALASHNESKTFNDGSQILLNKNVATESDSATLTFKANNSTGNTYQIKIYNPNESIDIQAAALPTALGTTYTYYYDGYTIITNEFINNGSVSQDISITPKRKYFDMPAFAQYESTSGLITVAKDNEDLGSINITYQNTSDISNRISAPWIGDKPYINHTQNTFYFQSRIITDSYSDHYNFIKSAGLTITVPDDVTIDPDTFIDAKSGKTLNGTKIAGNQYQVVLNNTLDEIAVKGLINVPADKLANGTAHLSGFGMKYTIHTYNDKVAPLVTTGTSKELSVIPDLASYHGDLININQSKWAFDRNGNEVYAYRSQGFTNTFNGVPLEPAVSTQVTNGVETFDMPAGVNITNFNPNFNSDPIDHIDYIYTDGSKQTDSDFNTTPKAIRQMKVYFKKGIQSDKLSGYSYGFRLSFDTTYPDGSPIKNFDTFKITGSFSCDELGSTDNVDVAQIMLAPTQKLTDGMMTNTDQDESNKVSNASGNFINARILNDNVLQHQGHLTNPIFYFKYNDLMVPDLSKISASYDNQNKGLGSIGLTNIDNNKIHSSIITDSTGQKFVKVQIDGEYYYVSSSDPSNPKSGFNVKIPISNTPDALSATKDWSWYILNNNDKAKTESTIQNSSQGNKLDSVTVDGNTLSVGGTGTWQIIVAQGFTSGTETQGNLNGGPGLASTQDDHQQDPTHFNIYDSIINATNDAKSDLVSVANLPSAQDGKSQFDVHMTGKASLINVMTGQAYDANITYSYGIGDNNFITGDQVTDWSKVKSIKVVPNSGAPSMTSLRLVVPVEDKTIYNDVGKTIYMSTMTYGEDKTNTKFTTKDGFAVPEKSTILPIIIKAGDMASAKLTVQGQATVHTLIHYKDANGKDVYVKLPDKDKTYNELQDTMKRSDYLQSDRDLTIADRGLLPTGMVINYNNPTIRNSNNTYAAGYANGAAAFDKTAKYDFDGDQVIFEGAMPEIVTKTHQVKETIHYVYRDDRTAKPDKVLTSVTVKQTGYKNPFTGKITWNTSTTDTLSSVDSPEITGYIADKLTVPPYVVTMDSPDKEVTVTYDADNENADFTYFDDTKNSALEVVKKSGKSNAPIGYTTTDEINNYEKQGYILVSDDTDGRNLNFDSLPTIDQHYTIHLKHKIENVPSRSDTVTRTIHYLYDDGKTAQPDKTQTVSFNETGTKDDVTGETTWSNDNAQTVDSVNTPSIVGYTPDKSSIEVQSFNFGDPDINVTVTYHANTQTAKITYIDDTTKTDLDSKNASGKFGQAITFETTPTVEIENYKKQGYVLVSNSFDNNKYQADDSNNVFYVHLKHGTKNVSRNDDVNMTVHYVMDDNSEAPSDNKQSLSFTENGIQDLVTKHIDWTPAESQTLDNVTSPVITGYTADIKIANGKVVNFGDPDINVTVTYHANTQTAKITYIDDTTKTNLDSKETSGKFGQAITFETTPTDEIAKYEKQGYVFVSNSFNNNKYQADNSNNVFYVHLKHGTKKVNREHSASVTVHYIYKNGKQAKPDHEQTLSFTEDGIQDLVTKKIIWTPADSQKFDDVTTPVITGYTPDQDKVIGQTANFETGNSEVTVTYLPDVQLGHINYIDDNTGKTLTRDDFSGRTNEHEDYTSTDRIQEFENKGYELVSNDYPDGGFNFDNNDRQDQVFNVHFKHGTVTVTTKNPQTPNTPINPDPQSPKYPKDINNTNKDVKRTIDYKFKDDKTVQPTVTDSLHFERTVVIDKVTGDVLSDTWTQSQNFSDIQTPAIQGYTPDRTAVSDKNISHDHQDIMEHVVYSPDTQHMTITYIDDTTGETLHTDKRDGVSDQDAKYTTSDTIKKYEDQHYTLVSDSTKGQDLIFDHDDNADQIYEVHFVHGKHAINQTTSPKQTIHYVYVNGLTRQGKVADDNVQQLSFKRDGYNDEVTGIDHWNAWTPVNSQYEAVDSPVIQGYTPDKLVVEKSTVNPTDKDTEVTVTYSADKQAAHVIYIDKTANITLASKDLFGKSDEDSEYNTGDKIGQYKSQHYVLFEDETNGKNVVFDHDDQQDQTYYVYFVHDTQKVNRQDTVMSTIDYKFEDGKTAQPTVTQTKYFSENGIKDLVTNKITWDEAKPQKFEDVATKSIVGYTPDKDNVVGSTVNFGDKDITETVIYHNNVQKAVITYVDDMTNNTLASDSQDGKFDYEVKFNNNPSDVISSFEKSGYKLVSNNFKDGTKYKADNKQNEFIVHLTHNMQSVSRQDKVTETIHYVYEDGSKSQPDHEQTISFNETGSKDLVTGKITWDEAKPQKFEDVVTPKMTGYTPDTDNVVGSTVKFGDQDAEVTVRYSANAQTATITYIDDTEKKTLVSDQQNGKFNQVITFDHDPAEVIKGLEEKGYKLVSDNFKSGNKYQADNKSNSFEVHLKHKTESVTRNGVVTRTIHYLYDDGNTAKPDKTQTVFFNETGTKDYVTGKTTWDNDDVQTVDSVITPSITGYTPDKGTVAGQTFKFGDKDIEVTVRYNANAQTATITYIDDTEKKTLGSDNQNGKFDREITFEHDPAEVVKGLEEKGYKLVSDNFKPGIKYQNDNKSNNFEVHLVHTYEPAETSQTITETVHYIDANGKPVAPDHVATVVVKVTGTRDKVTNTITWNTPSTGHFDEVLSPVVPNMTPDKKFIPSRDVRYGDSDITESVVYTLDEMPGESGKPNNSGNPTSKTPEKPNKPGDSTPKTPGKSNKPGNSTPKTPGKSNKSGKEVPKTSEKSNNSGKEVSKTPEKHNNSGKEVSNQRRTIAKTTIPEKHVDSRTADNQASAKSTTKRELPQTGATTSAGVWAGLASMIASLGLLGASKKRKKN